MKYDLNSFIIIIIIHHLTHLKRKYAYAIDEVDIDWFLVRWNSIKMRCSNTVLVYLRILRYIF